MPRPIGPTIEIAASSRVMRELERALELAPQKAQRAAIGALNRSLRSGRAAASREIREDLNLKKKVVDARIITKIISRRALVGSVAVRDRRIQLIEFMTPADIRRAYRQQRARRGKGVNVKVHKKKGRQLFPGTFVELGRKSQNWHVLKRKGTARYPVFIQYGPNMVDQFVKSLGRFAARANETLDKNFQNAIRRIFEGVQNG